MNSLDNYLLDIKNISNHKNSLLGLKSKKHFPVSTREWNNSIYVFNKNTLALIPQITVSAVNLITAYFNVYNWKIESILRKKKFTKRKQAISSNKTFVSNGEFKHTNDKLYITLYTYDRQNYFYLYTVINMLAKLFKKNLKKQLKNRFVLIKVNGLYYLKKINENKYILIKKLDSLKKQSKIINVKYVNFYKENLMNLYKDLISKTIPEIKTYIYYKQLIYINESKYNYTYLQILNNCLEKIYKKKIDFNLINIKHFALNSDIFLKMITLKITKNRQKLLNYLKKSIEITKKHVTHKKAFLKPNLNLNKVEDPIDRVLRNKVIPNKSYLKKIVIQELRYKYVGGVKLLISGRLTKRYTAARSTKKMKCWGSLANLDSSNKGLSTVLLKNNIKPNLQYTFLRSKTRIGSFGINIWINGI